MMSSTENPKSKTKSFFHTKIQDFMESLQGFNSSLAQTAAELWLAKIWPEMADVTFCATS